MCDRLTSFLGMHNILFDKQFGLRSEHNTDHAILSIVHVPVDTCKNTKSN